MAIILQLNMTFITDTETLNHYKRLKIEFYTYLDGYSKGGIMNRVKIFFRHLEDMIFGKDIDINDDTFL